MARKRALTASKLLGLLARRYAPPAWALLAQVPDRVSGRKTRTADAVAVCCWESRGLEIHGFEIKVHRSDWLKELRQPDKSEPIQRHCDRWWIVADKKIVDQNAGELPATWGLLVPDGRGLVTVVDAPQLDPAPLERHFVAAILRRAHQDMQHSDVETRVREELREEFEAAAKRGRQYEIDRLEHENERLRERLKGLHEAEKIAGCRISDWNIQGFANVTALLRNGGTAALEQRLTRIRDDFRTVVDQADGAIQELQGLKQDHQK